MTDDTFRAALADLLEAWDAAYDPSDFAYVNWQLIRANYRALLAQTEAQPPTEPTDADARLHPLYERWGSNTSRAAFLQGWSAALAAAHRTQEGRNDE